jgi:L-ascorbate metabolism protein UlaG (beta-lactamase superfamily)
MKSTIFTLLCLTISLAGPALAQEYPKDEIPTRQIKDEIRAHGSGVAIWWAGQNSWLIKSGDLLIGTDLVLEDEEPRLYQAPISAAELAPMLDVSFITHGHGDHFGRATSKILAEKSDCIFVMPVNCVNQAKKLGIPEERIRQAVPREPMQVESIKVLPLRALHGNPKFAVYEKANFQDCGYLFTFGGKKILQPGDSVLLEDHLFIGDVDVLFVSPTEHNTYIEPSVMLINELEPKIILPQHSGTFRATPENRYWTRGYAYEVGRLLSKPLKARFHILEHGEQILVP